MPAALSALPSGSDFLRGPVTWMLSPRDPGAPACTSVPGADCALGQVCTARAASRQAQVGEQAVLTALSRLFFEGVVATVCPGSRRDSAAGLGVRPGSPKL